MMKRDLLLKSLFYLGCLAACSKGHEDSKLNGSDANRLGVLQGNLLNQLEMISCPGPSTIKSKVIPSSYNSIYYAQSANTMFSGLDLGGLDVNKLSFSKAHVLETGGEWRLYCDYFGFTSLQHLSLATNGDSRFSNCKFSDGTASCTDSIESCQFVCPQDRSTRNTPPVY
jgi:hypothetical protein